MRSTDKNRVSVYVIREERLNDYFDLLAWGLRVGLLSQPEAQALRRNGFQHHNEASDVWKRSVALREAIYRISKALMSGRLPQEPDLQTLNRELKISHSRMTLVSGKDRLVWAWNDTKSRLDQILCSVADSAAKMLTTGDLTRLRQCPGEDCGWLVDDASRNRSRQWCDMKDCGNVAKVRRFRSRLRSPRHKKSSS